MFIEKIIAKYIVFAEDDIIVALKKISDNKSRIIFSVTEAGVLEGVLKDGDFRRWLVKQDTIDLNQPISRISNKNSQSAFYKEPLEKLQAWFKSDIEYLSLLDENNHLVAIACKRPRSIQIGYFSLSEQSPAFIIAEIGNNHNGSLDLAKQLIDEAVSAGANCAKFQSLLCLFLSFKLTFTLLGLG